MATYDFNSLSSTGDQPELHDAHVIARDAQVKPHDPATVKGKHGKKDHAEPAPAPVAPVGVPDVEDVDLSTPLAPTHDENKGFMRFMPALIKEMNRNGVPFTIDGNTGIITIDGFYKNGPMTLEVEANDDIVSIDKRTRRKVMKAYDDLVALNYKWWRGSTGRGVNVTPDRPWLDAFIAKNLVKRQVIFVPRDEQTTGDEE